MATQISSQSNGANGALHEFISKRFSDIPDSLDIPVQGQDDQDVEIDLLNLADDSSELCQLLEVENATRHYWMMISLAYAKEKKIDCAIDMLETGSKAMQGREKLSMVTALCWMYLFKSREAPRIAPEGTTEREVKTKEQYLGMATSSLNEALKLNPSFPPLFLARGVLQLLRASLATPSKGNTKSPETDRSELLRQALKSFDDALRVSQGKNMLALMGKARALYSMGKYPEALSSYQEVLLKLPDLVDPDPRIGIGCCFWQLGFKDDAKLAWDRCLQINPNSKIANILLGLYYLDSSGHVPVNSPEFLYLYKKAMTEYTQKSFKLDKTLPLTCATFANFFLARKALDNVDNLAHKAIQYTDVNAIASDGWYLLARKEHYAGDLGRAGDYYRRADEARGGTERGYLPAKLGAAQLLVTSDNLAEAKLALEKVIQLSKNYEAMILLGTIYSEEVFANQAASVREDKSSEEKKAISLLEGVRSAWKDPKKTLSPDAAVLLNLARLYETENPEKALECLKQVEELELAQIPQSERPTDAEDDAAAQAALYKLLPPQLLNNIGCFYSQAEKHKEASDMFEAALGACMRIDQSDEDMDTDALLTTITFNLGRSYESQGFQDKAIEAYEGLLKRHEGYTDARARLAYIMLRKKPNKEGPDAVAKLYQDNSSDLEVRALYAWYLGKVQSKKRPANVAEDPELRHYKHTLQHHDKHDRYALVGMGNMYLTSAREMRRETDQDKQKRSATYTRAVEFFEKALQLDPKNAYAAQGIAIALIEDKKDHKTALQIFAKVRETIKDAHMFINLGHVYAELQQFSKAIESYETALSKEGKANDPGILSCLGRTWLNRGRRERNLDAYKTALEYARKSLAIAPDQIHFKFNVAFVQIQLAMHLHALDDPAKRSTVQLEEAAEGLEAAIKSLDEIAAADSPPYPKHDIEQRANMARNTQRRQLERAITAQKEYEDKHKEKLTAALEVRDAAFRKREEERKKAEEEERQRQERIRKEREVIAARDRELAEQRAAEERAREDADMTNDSETGDRVKRKKKPRATARSSQSPAPERMSKKNKNAGRSRRRKDEDNGDESGEESRPKKKQRLTSRKESSVKYKSAEIVVDSDDDDLGRAERRLERNGTPTSLGGDSELSEIPEDDDAAPDRMEVEKSDGKAEADDNEDEAVSRPQASKRSRRGRVVDESDDEDEELEQPKETGDGGGGEEAAEPAAADVSMADKDEVDE